MHSSADENDSSSDEDSDSDSDSSSSNSSDGSDEDSEDEDAHPNDPLTSFFNSLRHGQTISMDSSDEEGDSSGDENDDDEDEGEGEERPTKPLPKRARPVIEVIGEAGQSGGMGTVVDERQGVEER